MNRRQFIKSGALLIPASYIAVPKSFGQLSRMPLAWDPNLLQAKVCRYRAADITGKNDGDTVTTWNDSWSTRTLTAATVIPVYKVNIVNGKPIVRFTVSSHGYATSAFAFPGNKVSVACIFATTTTLTSQIIAETSAQYFANNNTIVLDVNDIAAGSVMCGKNAAAGISYCNTTSLVTANVFALAMGTVDSGVTSGHQAQCYKWAPDATPGYRDDGFTTTNWSSFTLNIGARNASVTSVLLGDLAEIFFCSSVWNPVERLNIQSYARWFYGIGS